MKAIVYFCPPKDETMEHNQELAENTGKDLAYSWVLTSRFLFYCQMVIFMSLVAGGCYAMYKHAYKGKPKVEIPANTLYNPQYK